MKNDGMKSAIVTGSSGGIGLAVARRLARDGFAIVVNYAGNRTRAQERKRADPEDGKSQIVSIET